MQEQKNIIDCYNKTAKNYADKYLDELTHKHLDRILLNAFASENKDKGKMIDLGCGPGQTTNYLSGHGVKDITGTDLSIEMIKVAESLYPQNHFETADMLKLPYPDNSFGSAIAFYSIVHFDYTQIKTAFSEIKRVLMPGGQLLFSFHIGDNTVHLDEFLDHPVNIDFYFFDPNKIVDLLTETGFLIIDNIERAPYKDVEYPSRRAYLWAKRSPEDGKSAA